MGSKHHAAEDGMTKASESKRDHVRGSSLLLTGRVFSMLINMGFQVLLVRYLSRSDFGVIAYGLTVASFVQIAVSLGQERSVSRFLVFYDEEDRPDLVAGTLALYVLSVSVLGVLAFGTTLAIGGALVGGLDNPSAAAVVAILVFVAPVDSLDMMMQNTFAAFSRTRQIFLKKYIVNPLVKFSVVLLAVATGQSVEFVAATFVVTSIVGVTIYAVNLPPVLRERGIQIWPLRGNVTLPTGDVLRFSVPLVSSPLVWAAFGLGTSTVLAWSFNSDEVADYRAVWPAARLNMVVSSTFSVLFLPTLARHVAKGDEPVVRSSYWRTSAWVAVLTMPVFLATVPLARDTTVILFGERYASSATVLAIVSVGIYVDVVFGFNRQTLELYRRVWWVVASDVVTVVVNLGLALALIPEFGVNGAALATTISLVLRNMVNQLFVVRLTPVSWFDAHYLGVYGAIGIGLVVVGVVQFVTDPPAVAGYVLAAVCSLVALRANRAQLEVTDTFPEIRRVPVLGRFLK